MTDYELFKEYIKHHIPSFLKFSDNFGTYNFCEGQACHDCKVSVECTGGSIPYIEKERVLEYIKIYPENIL